MDDDDDDEDDDDDDDDDAAFYATCLMFSGQIHKYEKLVSFTRY